MEKEKLTPQQQRIYNVLSDFRDHCSTELLKTFCVDYRSQINKMRKKGYDIRPFPCKLGHNHDGRMNMWRLFEKDPQYVEICSVCKEQLTEDGNNRKCKCGNWVLSSFSKEWVFEDAHSIKPTLRFIIKHKING